MEEDMSRLRARQRGESLVARRPGEDALGLGAPAVRDVLPLKSTFYDWCIKYSKKPQMRQQEADESGSVEYHYQAWRRPRNEKVGTEATTQAQVDETSSWGKPVMTMHVAGASLNMAFTSYNPHLEANKADTIEYIPMFAGLSLYTKYPLAVYLTSPSAPYYLASATVTRRAPRSLWPGSLTRTLVGSCWSGQLVV